mgnify:CR=1 FL=1
MKFKSTTNLGEIAPRLAFIDNSKGIANYFCCYRTCSLSLYLW